MTDTEDDSRSPTEQQLLDTVAERKGEAWVEDHAELILAQARRVGAL